MMEEAADYKDKSMAEKKEELSFVSVQIVYAKTYPIRSIQCLLYFEIKTHNIALSSKCTILLIFLH